MPGKISKQEREDLIDEFVGNKGNKAFGNSLRNTFGPKVIAFKAQNGPIVTREEYINLLIESLDDLDKSSKEDLNFITIINAKSKSRTNGLSTVQRSFFDRMVDYGEQL